MCNSFGLHCIIPLSLSVGSPVSTCLTVFYFHYQFYPISAIPIFIRPESLLISF